MTPNEFAKLKEGKKIEETREEAAAPQAKPSALTANLGAYLSLLELLQRPLEHVDTAPTFVPRNFAEQVQLYDDGAARRAYFYVNGSWRYVTLT